MSQVFSVNQTPATGAAAMYQFKEALKNAGWTVEASSDGSTYNASGDQITSGSGGAGGMDNASAWFVIADPSEASRLCIQRNSATGTDSSREWRIKLARDEFSGGSPGSTQVPSATVETVLLGSGTDSSPGFADLFAAADGTYRVNVMAETTAPHGFYLVAFPTGGGDPIALLAADPMASGSYPSSDPAPLVWHCDGSGANILADHLFELAGTMTTAMRSGGSRPFVEIAAVMSVQAPGTTVVPNNVGANPENGADEGLPLIYIRDAGQSAPTGLKGWSGIFKITGTSRTTGDTGTVATSGDRIVFGRVTAPWNGSAPTI